MIGTGALGFHHVRLLQTLSDVCVVGCFDTDSARAAAVARDLGVRAYGTLDELLQAVEAVTVVVPTSAHYEVARAAIESGVHVFIEKPICATVAEADALLQAAVEAGVLVQTGHIERFNRAVRAALPFVAGPRFIESDRLAPFNPRGSDVAVAVSYTHLRAHETGRNLVCSLVGAPVSDVAAVGVPLLTKSVDIANARLTFATGAVANITASRVSKERLRKLRIFQPNGYFSLDLAAGEGEFYRLRRDVDLAALATAPLAIEAFVERIRLEASDEEPLRLELETFVAAVRGEAPVPVTGDDGRMALAVALRIVDEISSTAPP